MIGLRLLSALILLVLPGTSVAQRGDKKGEVQTARVPKDKIPPAPPLSPSDALRQFRVPAGFRVESVASEPLVETPVVLQFDPEGRPWVVEMRGYMPDPDGAGETNPVGRISILIDRNRDGRMDEKKVFLDGLVLPRALLLVEGGALVCEPPNLWFYPNRKDTPGPRELVASDFAREADPALGLRMNVEHSGNSLLRNLDNWIYSLSHPFRYRRREGRWVREPMPQRAQWGLAQDNFGRLFYTSNSDHLRGDLIASHYFANRPPKQKLPGLGLAIARDQTIWPARVNPGVNRGYDDGVLRSDGTLQKFTAACGTAVYRGDLFPPEFRDNAFVCEPAANLIRRNILTEQDGAIHAANPYEKDKSEFLTSQDELFRPVNLAVGPDGALYIVDMYHGIIQHRMYVTSYLRAQIEDRGLQKVIHRGRLWRVVPAPAPTSANPSRNLAEAGTIELVNLLAHPNGWWRDTSQRLLVERADASAAPALQQLAASQATPVARLHALWTLEGLGQLTASIVQLALRDPDPKLRAAGVRLTEGLLPRHTEARPTHSALHQEVLQLAGDPKPEVQVQVALTLGLLLPETKSRDALANLATNGNNSLVREVAAAALYPPGPTPGSSVSVLAAQGRPLTEEEKARMQAGKELYEATCLSCHQAHGLGQAGLAPPLAGTEWVSGSEDRLIRIVLNGLRGPITVKGEPFELDMPSLGVLDDDQIAAVLTYVRRAWGHTFEPVTPAKVKQVRDATADREDAWTMADLLKVP